MIWGLEFKFKPRIMLTLKRYEQLYTHVFMHFLYLTTSSLFYSYWGGVGVGGEQPREFKTLTNEILKPKILKVQFNGYSLKKREKLLAISTTHWSLNKQKLLKTAMHEHYLFIWESKSNAGVGRESLKETWHGVGSPMWG